MAKKLLVIAMLFLLLKSNNSGSDMKIESPPLNEKSFKNYFAKDLKFSTKNVTFQDLLKSPGSDWLVYHGDYQATHYSPLPEINRENIKNLVVKWTFNITDAPNLRSSPIVHNGIMYVTVANEVQALDAETGQWLWRWQAYKERGKGINRGVAIYENKLFFSTSDCRLVALNKMTGDLIWSTQYATSGQGQRYFSTMAPLVTKDRVVMGVGNHNDGEGGFIVAFSVSDGKELWRFRALPPASSLRGAPTWLTGSYDPATDIVYWAIGTLPDRQRSNPESYLPNAYHDSIVALNAKDGRLKWSVRLNKQLPMDWDPNEPLILTEVNNRKVILLADRNGIFYSIDRISGQIISTNPFVKEIEWNSKKRLCPSIRGATNWMPPSLSPITRLVYVTTLEGCAGEDNPFIIKAIDSASLKIKWSYFTRGTNVAAPGLLATAGNIVFGSEGSGHVVAIDAVNGKKLWDFGTGRAIFGAPVSYSLNHRQYISIVAGSDVYTFGLHKPAAK